MRIAIGLAIVGLLLMATHAHAGQREQTSEPSFLQRLGRALKDQADFEARTLPPPAYYVPPPSLSQRCTTTCYPRTNTCYTNCY